MPLLEIGLNFQRKQARESALVFEIPCLTYWLHMTLLNTKTLNKLMQLGRQGKSLVQVAILYSVFQGAALASEIDFPKDREVIFFNGRIDDDSVTSFIENSKKTPTKKLVMLTSKGGELLAGIRLGEWIHEIKADVAVRGICMSACANYAFAAGNRKFVLPNSLVVWHGNTFEPNFAKVIQKTELHIKELSVAPEKNQKEISKREQALSRMLYQHEREGAFFRKIGLNEYLLRAGEDIFGDSAVAWIAPKEIMEKYGFTNIVADPDYGTPAYLKGNPYTNQLKEDLFCLNINESGHPIVSQ